MGKRVRKQVSERSGVGFWTCDPKMSLGGGITLVCGHNNLKAWKGDGLELSRGRRMWTGPRHGLEIRLRRENLKVKRSAGLCSECQEG